MSGSHGGRGGSFKKHDLLSGGRLPVGYDLVLAITNVSGAFIDGFYSAWEDDVAVLYRAEPTPRRCTCTKDCGGFVYCNKGFLMGGGSGYESVGSVTACA